MNKKVLYIGGSPCCGKSTVAERLAKELGATYYQVDHYLDEFMEQVADRGAPVCSKAVKMKGDEIWLRDPEIQCEEEFKIYSEVAGRVFDRLHKIRSEFVIAEGAAFTPAVMAKSGFADYICMIPTPEFQIARYRERSWVPYVVMDCSDKECAFDDTLLIVLSFLIAFYCARSC